MLPKTKKFLVDLSANNPSLIISVVIKLKVLRNVVKNLSNLSLGCL